MLKDLFESVKVEAIAYVLLVYLAEEGVILEAAEPIDPAILLVRTV